MRLWQSMFSIPILFIIAILFLIGITGCTKVPVAKAPVPTVESVPNVSYPVGMFDPITKKTEEISDLSEYKRINVRMFRFGFDPEVITVNQGDKIMLTITSVDVGHGFALPEFGINVKVPPEESTTVQFIADITGNFSFFESIYSGPDWKDMQGTFIVKEI